MAIDSVLMPYGDNSTPPDAPYRSAIVRNLIGQTQCAGLLMSGNYKSFAIAEPLAVSVLVGNTAYEIYSLPWCVQVGYSEISMSVIFAANMSQAFQFRLVSDDLIDAVATTTGEWCGVVYPSGKASDNNWDDEPLLFGSAGIKLLPTLPASRRILLSLQVMVDGSLSTQQASDTLGVYLKQFIVNDRRVNG